MWRSRLIRPAAVLLILLKGKFGSRGQYGGPFDECTSNAIRDLRQEDTLGDLPAWHPASRDRRHRPARSDRLWNHRFSRDLLLGKPARDALFERGKYATQHLANRDHRSIDLSTHLFKRNALGVTQAHQALRDNRPERDRGPLPRQPCRLHRQQFVPRDRR